MKQSIIKTDTKIPDEEPTRQELIAWIDSEIAEMVLFVNDELPGEGLEYINKKTKEFTELIKQGKIQELEDIWKP